MHLYFPLEPGVDTLQVRGTLFYPFLQRCPDCFKLGIAAFKLDVGMPQAKMYADARQDFGGADRLGDIVDPASLERSQLVTFIFEGAEEDDRNGRSCFVGFEVFTYLVTVHIRHADIEQNQRRRLHPGATESQLALGGQTYPVARLIQYLLQQFEIGGCVVHHKDVVHRLLAGAHKALLPPSGWPNRPGPNLSNL